MGLWHKLISLFKPKKNEVVIVYNGRKVIIELDPNDPDPARTVEAIRAAYTNNPTRSVQVSAS